LEVIVESVRTNGEMPLDVCHIMEHSLKETLILSKRYTHPNGILIKMEYSSKWNTHQNGTLILSKWNSLNRNIHIKKELIGILIQMEHSYYQNGTH